jgi:hypothetical protein
MLMRGMIRLTSQTLMGMWQVLLQAEKNRREEQQKQLGIMKSLNSLVGYTAIFEIVFLMSFTIQGTEAYLGVIHLTSYSMQLLKHLADGSSVLPAERMTRHLTWPHPYLRVVE